MDPLGQLCMHSAQSVTDSCGADIPIEIADRLKSARQRILHEDGLCPGDRYSQSEGAPPGGWEAQDQDQVQDQRGGQEPCS